MCKRPGVLAGRCRRGLVFVWQRDRDHAGGVGDEHGPHREVALAVGRRARPGQQGAVGLVHGPGGVEPVRLILAGGRTNERRYVELDLDFLALNSAAATNAMIRRAHKRGRRSNVRSAGETADAAGGEQPAELGDGEAGVILDEDDEDGAEDGIGEEGDAEDGPAA